MPIIKGTYRSDNTIVSAGTIEANDSVTFKAMESITLKPGFIASNGVTFYAMIEDCESNNTISESAVARNKQDIAEDMPPLQLKIVPNPAYTNATVHYELTTPSTVSIQLHDFTGRTIMSIITSSNKEIGEYQQPINLMNLNKGIYFLLLKTGKSITTRKLIVQ